MDVQARKTAVASLSVASNTTLVLAKLVVGFLIGSVSVLSEAIHSGVDLIASAIALVAVRYSAMPADEEHPFGHGKIENLSGIAEALLIFAAAAWVFWEAAHKLTHPVPVDAPGWGVLVMCGSAAVNMIVSHMLFKVGRETDSMALQADAWHLRTDVYTSVGVMVGLALYWAGIHLLPGSNLAWIDPVAAMAVAALIARTAWDLSLRGMHELLDTRIDSDEEKRIHDIITTYPEIRGYHNLRTRKSGPRRFVDFHMVVDAHMTVVDSHAVAMQVTRQIEHELSEAGVTTHVEPCSHCTPRCLSGCLLTEEARVALHGPPPYHRPPREGDA